MRKNDSESEAGQVDDEADALVARDDAREEAEAQEVVDEDGNLNHDAQEKQDAQEHIGEDIIDALPSDYVPKLWDFPSVVTWCMPENRACAAHRRNASSAKIFAHEHTPDTAAVLLQRVVRGMADRKLYRKIRGMLDKKYAAEQKLRKATTSKKNKKVCISETVEVDGYLSQATRQRIQERGEPVERSEMMAKFMKIKTRSWAAFKMLKPNAQDSVWHAGEMRSVKWTTEGTMKINKVGLYLYRDGEPMMAMIKCVGNLGKYIFNMPESCELGDTYQVWHLCVYI